MNKYPEFNNLKIIEDPLNPFSTLYEYEDGTRFYIEPIYYSYLMNFKESYAQQFPLVLLEMERIVHRNKKVIFTGMDEEYEEDPATEAVGYIVLTLYDVLNKIGIIIDNKSRGSDYGD